MAKLKLTEAALKLLLEIETKPTHVVSYYKPIRTLIDYDLVLRINDDKYTISQNGQEYLDSLDS